MKKPDIENCTTNQYEKWYWNEFNENCKLCINTCKQSSIVQLVNCDKRKIGV